MVELIKIFSITLIAPIRVDYEAELREKVFLIINLIFKQKDCKSARLLTLNHPKFVNYYLKVYTHT
jgi:hypothetical protein